MRHGVADAEAQMLDVVDRLVQQRGYVAVVEAVDDVAPAAVAGHQAEVAQQPKLVGHRGLFHADRRRQFGHRARRLPQPGQDTQAVREASACSVSATLPAAAGLVSSGDARPFTPRPTGKFNHTRH
ncbi:hypothetical protein I553_9985 [Mycobacterium xenopi 4042]|uniref:Uncharacterized protein n=1 Tax=Mycobacterium xenopi 4042 TaxID=1299334 RepID=X7YQZ8_MYCXE|nr:hypothetical protein I553_9985 [Mycobacterium xenopi 4042]